jgi:hypothetical protein
MRGFVLLLLAGVMLCWVGILLCLPANSAPELPSAFVRADAAQEMDGGAHAPPQDASYPITAPGEEVREGEKLSVRASLLTSMLVVAASHFFTSGLVLVARNSSLKGGVSHPLGVLLGGSSAAASGRASLLGVFLL